MRLLLLFFLLSFVTAVTKAQPGIAFSHISTEDGIGLNSDMVYALAQDSKGFIWVGTANGLQRFDGSKFMSPGNFGRLSDAMPRNALTQIIHGNKDELWLHFPNRNEIGIFHPATLAYTTVPVKTSFDLPLRVDKRLWKDHRGNIYLTLWKWGVLKYDPASKSFTENNGLNLPKGWKPSPFSFVDTLTSRIWLPCPDSGMAMHDMRSGKTYTQKSNSVNHPILRLSHRNPQPSEIFIDAKRRYWIFSWDTIHHKRCYAEDGTPLTDTAGLSDNSGYQELRYFHQTSHGTLWMYGMNALYYANNNRMNFVDGREGRPYSVRYSNVNNIMEDREGSVWIATDEGLYFTSGESSSSDVVNMIFNHPRGNYEFTDILELKSGQYWLATWGSGVISLTNGLKRYEAGIYDRLPPADAITHAQYRQTWALYQQENGKIWIGCQAGKYIIHDPATGRSTFHQLPEAENATIRYITGDGRGNILFGTQRGHLIRYDGKEFRVVQRLGSIIRKIMPDRQGQLWLALEGTGVYCFNSSGEKLIRHFTAGKHPQALYQNLVYDLEELNDSTIICAAGAMNFINKNTGDVKWLGLEEGLPSNSLIRIRRDNLGYLWMITNNGLCRYNPVNNRITPYGRKDGIVLAKKTTEADYLTSSNHVMFAGESSLLIFRPASYNVKTPPPAVTITDLILAETYLPADSVMQRNVLQLDYNRSSFTINFSVLSFLQREKLTYYYRMKGIHKAWQKAEQLGTVSFSLLPPGKYTFEVYAENIDGLRSPQITSLNIHIRPPFWRTGWFLSTLLTLIVMTAYAMHRLRIRRLMAVETIRNRVARDLHDDMGSTLSTINILSAMAKAKLNTDVQKTGEYINKISDNSQRMMEAMDDIVWAIKPANDSMHKVVARMREFATSVFEAKDIELGFVADEAVNEVELDMEARRDLFLVFKEAVNNAAKYAKCTAAHVHIGTDGRKLLMQVRDNGIGFDIKAADSGNGLGNMRKRADALRGNLDISSVPGEGTTVTLTVPLNS